MNRMNRMKRTTIYLSDNIKNVIHKNEENLSGRLGTVCARYTMILKSESPIKQFSEAEIDIIVESLKNIPIDNAGVISAIPFFVTDYLSRQAYSKKTELINKLNRFSFVQLIAIVEEIELILKEKL